MFTEEKRTEIGLSAQMIRSRSPMMKTRKDEDEEASRRNPGHAAPNRCSVDLSNLKSFSLARAP